MKRNYRFVTDCIGSTYEAISALKESATDITRQTFQKYVDPKDWQELQSRLGYDKHFHISRDWHVGYWKGTYLGRPAVYVTWSAIEHIFTEPEQ